MNCTQVEKLCSISDSFQRHGRLLTFCLLLRGFLPRKKSELHRVLENKAREQLRKREQALRPRSDLEVKLQRRRQKLELVSSQTQKNKIQLFTDSFSLGVCNLKQTDTNSSMFSVSQYELEEKRWRAGLKNVPEFIHVRQTLRHVPHSS